MAASTDIVIIRRLVYKYSGVAIIITRIIFISSEKDFIVRDWRWLFAVNGLPDICSQAGICHITRINWPTELFQLSRA
jgi:hypothetical protein